MKRSTQTLCELAVQLARSQRSLIAHLGRELANYGANMAQYQLLYRLAIAGPLPQKDLAQESILDASGVSRMLVTMNDRGWISVQPHASDRRQQLVRVTPSGRRLEQRLSPVVQGALKACTAGLSQSERRQLLHLLLRCTGGAP